MPVLTDIGFQSHSSLIAVKPDVSRHEDIGSNPSLPPYRLRRDIPERLPERLAAGAGTMLSGIRQPFNRSSCCQGCGSL